MAIQRHRGNCIFSDVVQHILAFAVKAETDGRHDEPAVSAGHVSPCLSATVLEYLFTV